jgi:hypothetical protein
MDANDAAPKVPCRVCREPILSGAKKCIHCNSYQSLLFRVLSSGPALSLLVALVAVTTPWVPVVKEALAPKGTVLKTAFAGVSGNSLDVAVTNVGSLPGSVHMISFAIGGEKAVTSYPLQLQNSSLLVEPGKTIVVRGHLLGGEAAPQFPGGPIGALLKPGSPTLLVCCKPIVTGLSAFWRSRQSEKPKRSRSHNTHYDFDLAIMRDQRQTHQEGSHQARRRAARRTAVIVRCEYCCRGSLGPNAQSRS